MITTACMVLANQLVYVITFSEVLYYFFYLEMYNSFCIRVLHGNFETADTLIQDSFVGEAEKRWKLIPIKYVPEE